MSSTAVVMKKKKSSAVLRRVLLYIVLILIAVIMVVPFLWMLSTSLKTQYDAVKIPPVWIPDPLCEALYGAADVPVHAEHH